MKGRVFILTPDSPERAGGVEHFVREMIKGLERRGYEVGVFHRGNSEPKWLSTRTGRIGKKLTGTLNGFWIGRNAQKHLTDNVIMVISNSDVGYYRLRSKTAVKLVHFYHGTYRAQSEAIRTFISRTGYLYLKWWNSMVLERLSGRSKLVLANSEQVRDEVKQFFGQEATTVWLPIDTERFKPADSSASRRALNLPTDRPVGLFVGSAHPMKGLSIVRLLMDRLPEVHWVLALRGDLPENKVARRDVTMFQNVSPKQISLFYNAADFSVCPSLYEPFGYVVAESLACGTPVIASPGGASRLFLRERPLDRLFISDPNAVNGFLGAAREVLRDSSFYRRAVIERVRPKLEELMAHENWWRRFFEVAGL